MDSFEESRDAEGYLAGLLGPNPGFQAAALGDVPLNAQAVASHVVMAQEVEEMSLLQQEASFSLNGSFCETQAHFERGIGAGVAEDSIGGAGGVIMEETEAEEEELEMDELEESLETAEGGTGGAATAVQETVDTTGLQRHSDDPYLSKFASQSSDQLEPFSEMPPPPVEDSSAFPSSSASVAERLLSPRKRLSVANSSGRNGNELPSAHQEPQSSADPDLSASALLPGSRSSSGNNPPFMASGNPFGGNISGDNSFSGPTTSTPAGVFAAPHPLTASRTVPTIGLLPMQERLDSTPHTVSSPPPPKSTGFYQSSAAAKAIPPPQREKPIARQWYEDEDEHSPEGASPDHQLDETVVEEETVVDEEGEKDMTISESQGASRPVLEPLDNAEDTSIATAATRDDPLDVLPPTSDLRQDSVEPIAPSHQALPAPRQTSVDPPTSASDAPAAAQPRPLVSDPPQASTSHQSSVLRNAVSELTTTDNSEGPMSLSGIGDLQSSMEIPSNYVPEMTQASPSADTFQHVNSSSRSPSPADSDKAEERSLHEFDVDTGVIGSDRQHTNPRPGRELRRNPPPVTSEPEARQSSPAKAPPASTVIVPATSPTPEPIVEVAVTVVEKRMQAIIQLPASTSKSIPAAPVEPENDGHSTPAAAFSTPRNDSPQVEETVAVEPEEVEEPNRAEPSVVEQEVAPAAGPVSPALDFPQVPAPVVQPKKVVSKAKSKGKGKAKERVVAPPTDSPDALDLFRKSQKNPMQEVEQVEETIIEGGDDMEETNYDEFPTPQNGRKRAGRREAGFRRQQSPSPAVSTSASPRNKRQRLSEPTVEIGAPRKKRRASVSPSKSKGKSTKDSHATLSPRARSARPKRSLRELSTSAELSDSTGANAVATTSKVKRPRASGTTSLDPTASKRARLSNKGTTSSMPFSRVFALWRDDHYLYPGTIIQVVGRACKILFDDDSEATVKFHDLRRCELKQGDVVKYRGDEEDPETQVLQNELMVLRVERGKAGEDYSGELAKKDIMVGTKMVKDFSEQATMSKQRIDIEALCVPPEFTKKLDDRKFTEQEIDQLSTLDPTAVSRALPAKAVKVVARTTPAANATAANLFAGFGFIVTRVVYDKSASSDASTSNEKITSMASQEIVVEKAAFDRRLVKNGATIIDVDDLFAVDSHNSTKLLAKFASTKFSKLHTILLLADRPSTTPKYMVALALGIPCVSRLFIQASEDAGEEIDWKQFVITAGYSQALGTHAIGGQMKALTGNTFDLNSFAKNHPATALFHERSFLIVLPKKTERENQMGTLRRILVAAGAQQVDFVHTVAEAKSGDIYDFVFLEDKQKISVALESHSGIANIEWMKQCLINGRVLDAERMKAVEALMRD